MRESGLLKRVGRSFGRRSHARGLSVLSAAVAALVLNLGSVGAQTDPALREPGVLYLEDNVPHAVTTELHTATSLYLHRDYQTLLAVLPPGQKVEVLGSSPEGYLLKGSARNNTVEGWIRPPDLPTGFDLNVFVLAKKNEDRRAAMAVAIANKTVITGMTPEEVERAVGHPTETSSRTDGRGSSLAWIFTTYREEPQYSYALTPDGRPLLQTYYVKIPIGRMTINFQGGVVSEIEQTKSDPSSGVVTN